MQQPLKAFPLFKSVDHALSKVYEVLQTSGVKTATYGVPTAASSSTEKLSKFDRLTEAAWVTAVVDSVLTPTQRAWVACTYEGFTNARNGAIEQLTILNAGAHANIDLVRALVTQHFDFGETFCKSAAEIGRETGVSQPTAWRTGQKVSRSIDRVGAEVERALRAEFVPRGWLSGPAESAA